MSVHRFYAPNLTHAGDKVRLPDGEAHHLCRVLRLSAGTPVRVFDGRGREHDATVVRNNSHEASVEIGQQVETNTEPLVQVTIGVTMLKGRKLDIVVRDAAMLGVAAITPLRTSRTSCSSSTRDDTHIVDRWRSIAVASCKQCGRALVPTIGAPVDFATFVDHVAALGGQRMLFIEPAAVVPTPDLIPLRSFQTTPRPPNASILIGPEGGWTSEEVIYARDAGFTLVTLGSRTLRADAAPIVALSILRFMWSDL